MSMKRCFELSMSPSVSLFGRAMLLGGVLSFATACAHRDTRRTDSTVASVDSTATTSVASTPVAPASAVESVSTGETSITSDTKAPAAPTAATTPEPSATAKTHAPVHHVVHKHTDSTTKATPAASSQAAVTAASADTGQKAAPAGTATAAGAKDALLVSPAEYEGWKMFHVYCFRCHGVDAMGGGIAPNLRHSVSSEGSVTHDVFVKTVTNGRLDKGMPTWKELLSPEQIEDLWAYVTARSSGRLAPGRPHMAKSN
jgi:mono/diheme cytochrome c family protein